MTAAPLRTASVTGEALGTTTRVVATRPDALPALALLADDWLRRLDRAASRFREDSELSTANAGAGRPVRVGPVLADTVAASLAMAEATGGLVDPTIGRALVDAGYDRTFRLVPAGHGRLRAVAQPRPGWRDVRLTTDPDGGWLTVPAGCRLDLGAVAKAWLADTIAALGARPGLGVLVDLGGDMAVAGPPPRHGWLVGLPPGSDGQRTVSITAGGVATSAQDARAWRSADGPAHHIIDPRTGLPARSPWRCVTVHAATAVEANAASTAAVVLGEDAVGWLARQGLAARLVPLDGGPVVRVGPWPDPRAATGGGPDRAGLVTTQVPA